MKPPFFRLPERIGWRDHLIGVVLGAVYAAWLLSGARELGFPRDEGIYFHAGTEYARWWRSIPERGSDAFKQSVIDAAFSANHEHPPLMKTLFGLSGWLFHEKWRFFADASTAMRLPAMATAGMAIWVIYLFGARLWSRRAGLAAGTLFALMPRVFFHAHLACFDVPITAMWILCVYAYWRATETRRFGWILWFGVTYGLALATKHNAWELPFVFVPHAFFVQRHAFWRSLKAARVAIPGTLVSMVLVGPVVFLALWPYVWNDTVARLEWWVEFHLHHDYYNIEFLGKNYFSAPSPRSYLPVMVVATVPTITLLLFFAGAMDRGAVAARRVRARLSKRFKRPVANLPPRDPCETDLLLALSVFAAIVLFFLPRTPIFGGTKHWMPAYPVLALYAGRGFDLVVAAMKRALPASLDRGRHFALQVLLFACVTFGPLAITAHSHPFGLSSYVPLIGGTAGGADFGLNRQFWGYTTQQAAEEYLDGKAPRGASVFIHDTTWDAWSRMEEEGRVRSDLRAVGAPGDAMFSLVQHELHMNEVDYSIWVADGTDAPAYIVEHDGVPIVSVYKRP